MNIQDALKETGKADDSRDSDLYVAIDTGGILFWFYKSNDIVHTPVSLKNIQERDWQPYNPKPQIVPSEAGELWEDNGEYWHTDYIQGILSFIGATRTLFVECANGKKLLSNLTRLYPPVPNDNETYPKGGKMTPPDYEEIDEEEVLDLEEDEMEVEEDFEEEQEEG